MKHHATTYVSVNKELGETGLRRLAAQRLGGYEGMRCINSTLIGDNLCGTFVRDWESPDPVTLVVSNPERVTHTEDDDELA